MKNPRGTEEPPICVRDPDFGASKELTDDIHQHTNDLYLVGGRGVPS
jgi:hypothetical protein